MLVQYYLIIISIWFKYLLFLLYSLSEALKLAELPEGWVEWFLYRLQHEPWALGGAVVVAVFVLGTVSLVVFALVYGCCCNPPDVKQGARKLKRSNDGVI